METVESRTPFVRDPRAKYRQSLEVLRVAKAAKDGLITKTSIMLGVGETDEEVMQTLRGESAERERANWHVADCFLPLQTCATTTSTSSPSVSTCARRSGT